MCFCISGNDCWFGEYCLSNSRILLGSKSKLTLDQAKSVAFRCASRYGVAIRLCDGKDFICEIEPPCYEDDDERDYEDEE